jgi:hypothetical protein
VVSLFTPNYSPACADSVSAQTEAQGDLMGDDFLSREKAILGDDANQFSTGNDHTAFVEDDGGDLLGGGGDNEEVTEFESSFPAIDSRNKVRFIISFTMIR